MGRRKEEVIPGNPIFIQWLEELLEEAKERDQTNLKFCYQKALANLKAIQEPLRPKELVKVQGIGPNIVKRIEKKVDEFLASGRTRLDLYRPGVDPSDIMDPASVSKVVDTSTATTAGIKRTKSNTSLSPTLAADPDNATKKRQRKPKQYIPTYRSGAYALLICLHEQMQRGQLYLCKTELQRLAQPYADASFTDVEPGKQFYRAWNSMSTLVEKGLVLKQGLPAKYYLTDEGGELARELYEKSLAFEGRAIGSGDGAGDGLNGNSTPRADMQSVSRNVRKSSVTMISATPISTTTTVRQETQSESTFYFWYLNSDKTRVTSKDDAQVKIDVTGMSCKMRIEYHHVQASHSFAAKIEKETLVPDASGMLLGYLDDMDAPMLCPGVDPIALARLLEPKHPQQARSTSETVPAKSAAKPISRPPRIPDASVSSSNPESSTPRPAPANFKHYPAGKTPERLPVPTFAPLVLRPGTFTVQLIVDGREIRGKSDRDFMVNQLRARGVDCESRVLNVGDVTWIAKSKTGEPDVILDFILERKRMDDLVSSITDGRFFEQKCGIRNVFYLVEDFSSHTVQQFGRDALRTAMASVQTLSGFFLKRTSGADDTIRMLASMHKYICDFYRTATVHALPGSILQKETFVQLQNQMEETHGKQYHLPYHMFNELNSKSGTSTIKEVWFKQLACVRGISAEKAQNIVATYPTPLSLLEALNSLPSRDDQVKLLKKLNGPVQRRNLGDVLCRRLIDLLCLEVYPEQ